MKDLDLFDRSMIIFLILACCGLTLALSFAYTNDQIGKTKTPPCPTCGK